MEMEVSLQRSHQVQQPRTAPAFVPFLKRQIINALPSGKAWSCSSYRPGLGLYRVALDL